MASLGSPPQGTDLTEIKTPELIAAFSITSALGVVFVGLRVLCRKLTKNRLWLDDWLIIVSLLWSGALMFDVTCYMAKHGFGKHVWAAPPEASEVWAMGLFIAEFAYTLSLVCIKCSILAFIWRIFGTESTIKLPIWILFGMICAWGIAVILVSTFQCLPIYAIWERFDPVNPISASDYSCGVDISKFFIGNAVPNIITDLFIILLPLPYIWKMRCLRWAQKVAITGIFIVGIFVMIISSVRLIFLITLDLKSPDVTWNESDAAMWTGVEVNVATVCACLPSLKPMLNLLIYGAFYSESQSHGTPEINTIGGSAEVAKKRARPPQLSYSSQYASTTHIGTANRGVVIDDGHPFVELADNVSDTWQASLEAVELEHTSRNAMMLRV